MKQNEIKVPISAELCNYIQRLMFEKKNLLFIITRFFEKHANDEDTSLLVDPAFLEYHKQLELVSYEYEMVKINISKMVNSFLHSIDIHNLADFEWSIDDFINEKYIKIKKIDRR